MGQVFGPLLWIRLILAVVWVGPPVLLVGTWVWWTTRRRRDVADSRVRRARTARLIGLGLGALVGIVAVFLALAWLAPIAVACGYLAGVLTGELRDAPPRTGDVRVASLQPRTAAHYVPRWAAVVAIVAAALTIATPVVLTMVPAATYGPWHPFPDEPSFTLPGRSLAWPAPAQWVPIAVVAAGALVLGAMLIRRALRLPAADADQPGLLESTRRNAARTIAGTVVGVELLALGGLTLFTSDGLAVPGPVGGGAYTGSRILVWTGLGLLVTGIVLWCALSGWRRGHGRS